MRSGALPGERGFDGSAVPHAPEVPATAPGCPGGADPARRGHHHLPHPCYALGWRIGDKGTQARIRLLRGVDQKHEFTLVCRDLSEIALYAKVDNSAYRLIKSLTPGPYTFYLESDPRGPAAFAGAAP